MLRAIRNLTLLTALILLPQTARAENPCDLSPNCLSLEECTALAEEGDAHAQVILSGIYFESGEVEKSEEWILKAAAQDFPPAWHDLGNFYSEQDPPDYNGAAKYWIKAGEAGCLPSQHNLGVFYSGLTNATPHNFNGRLPNYEQALYWYTQSAKQGSPDSQYNLAIMYNNGEGTKQDLIEAYAWMMTAADQGYDNAAALGEQIYDVLYLWEKKKARKRAEEYIKTYAKPFKSLE